MHALHKAMKMRAHFALKRQCVVERIHQIRFAATDTAPKIEAANRLDFFLAPEFCAQRRPQGVVRGGSFSCNQLLEELL